MLRNPRIVLLCSATLWLQTARSMVIGAEPAAEGNYSASLAFPENREAEQSLAAAAEELSAGNIAAGLSHVQGVLDGPTDSLVVTRGAFRSAWETANHFITNLPAETRADYVRLYRESAQRQLSAARAGSDWSDVARLTDQYRHTPAGAEAAVLLAQLAFDRGEPDTARGWLSSLANRSTTEALRARIEDLHQRITSDTASEETANTPWKSAAPLAADVVAWTSAFDFAGSARRALDESFAELDAQGLTPILTCRPVIVDGRVITRTLRGLICIDAADGRTLWDHRIASHAGSLAGGPGELENPLRLGQVSAALLRRTVRDSLQDHLTADTERIYTVIVDGQGGAGNGAKKVPATNALRAVNVTDGTLVWQLTPSDGFWSIDPPVSVADGRTRRQLGTLASQDGPAEDTLCFLGPPLVDGSRLLVLTQRQSQVELVALDAITAKTLWTVPLGRSVRDVEDDRERLSTACHLAKQGSRVICPTASGAVVCVDELKRRVVWAFRYPRRDVSITTTPVEELTQPSEMPTTNAWPASVAWTAAGLAVCVASDADSVFGLNEETGAQLWSVPRGDGLEALPLGSERFVIIGEAGVTARSLADGALLWRTPISRPAGTAILRGDELIVPIAHGRHESIALDNGARRTHADEQRTRLRVDTHPPRGLHNVDLRNLFTAGDVILSQSAVALERHAHLQPRDVQTASIRTQFATRLAPLADMRVTLDPLLAPLRQFDCRLGVADVLLLALIDAAGLRTSAADRATTLLQGLSRPSEAGTESVEPALRELLKLDLQHLYVTSADGAGSRRLDRWLLGMSEDKTLFPPLPEIDGLSPPLTSPPASAPCRIDSEPSVDPESVWPAVTPTVTEQATSFGDSYFIRVPMTTGPSSPWRQVTVEVDRQGKAILLHDASQPRPVSILLPREQGTSRLIPEFLHAWAPQDVLLVRIGTELVAFERRPGEPLPDTALWPANEQTLSLLGPRPPLLMSLVELGADAVEDWNRTSPGFEDVFGRRIGEVGPVRPNYLCYQQRGHLICLDARSGNELWRRSRLPVGTRCIGHDEQVVLFRPGSAKFTVLSAVDGRTRREWDAADAAGDNAEVAAGLSNPPLINAATAALTVRAPEGLEVHAIDMTAGTTVWTRTFGAAARLFPVSECLLGVVEPPLADAAGNVQLLDWERGDTRSGHHVSIPADLRRIFTFSDGETAFLIASGKVTDRELLRARQIQDGLRRPAVNGWLHAFDCRTGAHRWERRLENVAFPLDQPRHVPLLIVNDVIQTESVTTPTGRLECIDRRTGRTLASASAPLHIYTAVEADPSRKTVGIRIQGKTVRFDYSGAEAPD